MSNKICAIVFEPYISGFLIPRRFKFGPFNIKIEN